MKINDWVGLGTQFEKMNKQLDKVMRAEGLSTPPKVYIKGLMELEDFLDKAVANKAAIKKMSKTNAKALNGMKQRLKKNNKEYEPLISKMRENPEETESEDESESESESDSSDSDSGSGDESDASDTIDESRFQAKKNKAELAKEKFMSMKPEEITYEMVSQKLHEIVTSRGKKGVDRKDMVEQLTYLATVAKTAAQKVQVLVHVISSQFDVAPTLSSHLPTKVWQGTIQNVFRVLEILAANAYITMDPTFEPDLENDKEEPEEGVPVTVWGNLLGFTERLDDELFKSLQAMDVHTHEYLLRMRDSVTFLALCQKVAAYYAAKQEPVTVARVGLRRIEHLYYKTADVYDAMQKMVANEQVAAAAAREEDAKEQAERAARLEAALAAGEEPPEEPEGPSIEERFPLPPGFELQEGLEKTLRQLFVFIYKFGDERTKARTMLCHIFHKCIHDDFHTARDLMLMSHLQENVSNMDISTQILFNRTMAQLGLCAFRAGIFREASLCLSELWVTGRIRELLAQGMAGRWQEKTPEQEKLEKRRLMPFHMHINLELLEAAQLISFMLREVCYLVAPETGAKKRLSKPFQRFLNTFDRQTFQGAPENVRDHVMACTRAICVGDWKTGFEYLEKLPIWDLMGKKKEEVKAMIQRHVKEESLRTFLIVFGTQYKSLSLDQLCSMFEMEESKVHSVASRMMITEELHGSWHQPTRSIVMHTSEPTKLQRLALKSALKVEQMIENNEKALSFRTGTLHEKDDDDRRGRHSFRDNDGGGRRKQNYGRNNQRHSNFQHHRRKDGREKKGGYVKKVFADSYANFSRKTREPQREMVKLG